MWLEADCIEAVDLAHLHNGLSVLKQAASSLKLLLEKGH